MSGASTSHSSQNELSPPTLAKLPLEIRQKILYLATSVDYVDPSDGIVKNIQQLPGKISTLMRLNKLIRSDMAFVIKQHKKEVWTQYDKLEVGATIGLRNEAASSVENIGANLTYLKNALDVAFVIHRLTKLVS